MHVEMQNVSARDVLLKVHSSIYKAKRTEKNVSCPWAVMSHMDIQYEHTHKVLSTVNVL